MKKITLIIAGIVLILIVAGIWVYLMLFGSPQGSGDVFSNFGFLGDDQPIVTEERPTVVDTAPFTSDGSPQALRQLTTRPVAGAVFIDGGIRYVERGTGHIYDVTFSSGNESLRSGTTIARVTEAIFPPDGEQVAIISEVDRTHTTVVGTLSDEDGESGVFNGVSLPLGSHEVAFSTSGEEVYYLGATESGSSGYIYNLTDETSRELFRIPLRDVEVLWGDDIYVYTKPTAEQIGYVYKVAGNELNYVTEGRPGLMAIAGDEGVVISFTHNSIITSKATESGFDYIGTFPEKCVNDASATSSLYCAAPLEFPKGTYPDDWYKGIVSLQDALWKINTVTGETQIFTIFRDATGRDIDVSTIGTNTDGTLIYFINKNDDTLWMFDTTL